VPSIRKILHRIGEKDASSIIQREASDKKGKNGFRA
jgi:hypothetical protein